MAHETMEHLTWRLATALTHDDGAELLHLLTCAECRDAATAVLRAGDGVPGVPVPDYDPMFRRLEANLVHLASAAGSVPAEKISCSAFALRVALRLAGKRVEPPPAA